LFQESEIGGNGGVSHRIEVIVERPGAQWGLAASTTTAVSKILGLFG